MVNRKHNTPPVIKAQSFENCAYTEEGNPGLLARIIQVMFKLNAVRKHSVF